MSAEKRNYITVRELVDTALDEVKKENVIIEAENDCPLDYIITNSKVELDKLYRCSFDVTGQTCYGGSEGVYGEIYLIGKWKQEGKEDAEQRSYARICTLKTLAASKKAYLAMGSIVNSLCYHANHFVAENIGRFD